MAGRAKGLYEAILTEALAAELASPGSDLVPRIESLDAGDAADRLALHVGRIIRRAIESESDRRRVELGVALVRQLVELIHSGLSDQESRARDL
ncbi:MAG: hypothetical protein ACO4CT_13510 [Planctomycetota bacterium]|jgi:hypothetical protein